MKRRDFVASAAGVGTLSLFPAGLAGLEREKGPAGLERRALGKIEPHRKGVFLACKTQKRTKEEANAELESSLRKMRTDHFDLYQHHAVTTKADAERILGPGGAMEAFEAARKAGKVRFVGFSAQPSRSGAPRGESFDRARGTEGSSRCDG